MPITVTFAQAELNHKVTTITNTTGFLLTDGTAGGADASDIRTYMLADASVAAVPTVAALSVSVAANTAAISALSSRGGLIANHQSATAISNTSVQQTLDNYAADGTVTMNSGDRLIHIMQFMVVNTSGSPVNVTLLEKINNQNTFSYNSFPFASGTGSYACNVYTEYVQGSLSPNTNHSQSCVWSIAGPYSGGSITGTGVAVTTTGPAAVDYPLAYLTSVADYGLTQPQFQSLLTFGTAASTISMQRISSSLTLLRA